jgi:hypothetical protein
VEDLSEGLDSPVWRVGGISHVEEVNQLFTIRQVAAAIGILLPDSFKKIDIDIGAMQTNGISMLVDSANYCSTTATTPRLSPYLGWPGAYHLRPASVLTTHRGVLAQQ